MARVVIVLATILLIQARLGVGAAINASVTLVQGGKAVAVESARIEEFTNRAIELLRSATFEADRSIASDDRMAKARQSSHLRLLFKPARDIRMSSGRDESAAESKLFASEVVMAISAANSPDYLFVRDRGRVRAFAKYRPDAAQRLQSLLK